MANPEQGRVGIEKEKLNIMEHTQNIIERVKERNFYLEKRGINVEPSNPVVKNLETLVRLMEENKLPPGAMENFLNLLEEDKKIGERMKQVLAKINSIVQELETRGFKFLKYHDPQKVVWRERHESAYKEMNDCDEHLKRIEEALAETVKEFSS